MIAQGSGIKDVAAAFGVTRKVVEKRMTLGRVAPRLLAEYRKGNFNLEAIMAFTVTGIQERQIACYKDLKQGHMSAHRVRQWVLGETVVAGQGVGAFVGKTVYVAAGGAVSTDLFEEETHFLDTGLVLELAHKKLAAQVAKIEKADDWLWVAGSLDRHEALEGLVHLQPELVGVPEELAAKIEALNKQVMAWEELYYDDELPEGEDEASFERKLDAARDELEKLEEGRDAKYHVFTEEQRAQSGCVVTVDRQGKLEKVSGLARRKDLQKQEKSTQSDQGDGAGEGEPVVKGISQALQSDLGVYRQQATKAVLLKHPAAAMDLLHYSLCLQVFGCSRWEGTDALDTHLSEVASISSRDDTGESQAFTELAAFLEKCPQQWLLIEDVAERFAAFSALPRKTKDTLVTYCVAVSLRIGIAGSGYGLQDALVERLGVAFADYWRPSKNNYLGRLDKAQLFEQFGPVKGQGWVDFHSDSKKSAVVESLDEFFKEKPESEDDPRGTWLPPQF
jgi:ParB family chromosome partitioning protein